MVVRAGLLKMQRAGSTRLPRRLTTLAADRARRSPARWGRLLFARRAGGQLPLEG